MGSKVSDTMGRIHGQITAVIMAQRMAETRRLANQVAVVRRNDIADHLLAISKHSGEAVDLLLTADFDHDACPAAMNRFEAERDALYGLLKRIADGA